MYSKVKTLDLLHPNLYKDKVLWFQVFFATLFFVSSGIWLSAIPLGVKYNLHFSETIIGITGLIFALGAWSSRFISSYLVGKFSKHEIIFSGLLLMLIAGLIPFLYPSITGVLISRFINGVADSMAYIGLSTLVVANSSEKEQGKALSLYTICLYMGVGVGPIIGEFIYRHYENDVIKNSGFFVICSSLFLMFLLRFVPTRYKAVEEKEKKVSVFAKPVLLPGLIFMLGMGTYVGFVQFASIFTRNIGMSDSSTFYLVLGLGVISVRTIFSSFFDKINVKTLLYISLLCGFVCAMILANTQSAFFLYVAIGFLIFCNGMFYPSLVVCALRRSTNYDKTTVLGSLGVFFDTAFGILPIFLGYIASEMSYMAMFYIVSICSILGSALVFSMKVPKLTGSSSEL